MHSSKSYQLKFNPTNKPRVFKSIRQVLNVFIPNKVCNIQVPPKHNHTEPIVPIHRSATMYLPLEVIMLLDAVCGWQQMNINNVSLPHGVSVVSLIFSLKMSSLITYMPCHVCFGIPFVTMIAHFGMLNMVLSEYRDVFSREANKNITHSLKFGRKLGFEAMMYICLSFFEIPRKGFILSRSVIV